MSDPVAEKVAETRNQIQALTRTRDAAQRQLEKANRDIEVAEIRLQAYLELLPGHQGAEDESIGATPWDEAFAALRKLGRPFTPDDLDKQLVVLNGQVTRKTIGNKLYKMKEDRKIVRVGRGRYKFPTVHEAA